MWRGWRLFIAGVSATALFGAGVLLSTSSFGDGGGADARYPWLRRYDAQNSIAQRIAPPSGFVRARATEGSFAAWLRGLALRPGRPDVRLFDGRPKQNQDAHVAVLDLDVGNEDLQQCADAVIRLRGEYLWASGRADEAVFHFTSGDACAWKEWKRGSRPTVIRDQVTWSTKAAPDASYAAFEAYLKAVFRYAGTRSLAKELESIADCRAIRAGDVFVQGGSPGHAVIVVDVASRDVNGQCEKVFLLAQSYMPAQEMHILRNPKNETLSPWYPAEFGAELRTPEWRFANRDLKRFATEGEGDVAPARKPK